MWEGAVRWERCVRSRELRARATEQDESDKRPKRKSKAKLSLFRSGR